MLRLLLSNKIRQDIYEAYKNDKEEKFREQENQISKKQDIPRVYRHKEPLNIFGQSYVKTVFDAFSHNHITLSKASTYLDNLKIHSLKKLQYDL